MAEKEKSKRSLFTRVVDVHTGGKLNLLKGNNSLLSGIGERQVSPSPSEKFAERHKESHGTGLEESLVSNKKRQSLTSLSGQATAMSDTLRAEMTHLLLESVSKCSRQKMRFILMTLRRLGGVDGYMSYGDLSKVLQDNGLIIPSTASGIMLNACSDNLGVDSEKFWKLLMEVHGQSDRDSVRARKSMHLRAPVISVFADPGGDRELLERMETEMLAAGAANSPFDLNAFKTAVLGLDKTRRGHVPNTQLLKTCRDYGFPVKGDLLKSLLIRCDDDNSGKISHREFFVLMDKALDSAVKVNSKLFQKKEEHTKKRVDTGRLMGDGAVTKVASLGAGSGKNGIQEGDENTGMAPPSPGGYIDGAFISEDTSSPLRKASLMPGSEEPPGGKTKGRMMGRMKGFLGRKKGGAAAVGADGNILDVDSTGDTVSIASSVYSSVSRTTGLYGRGELGGNGIAEKPIHPVVRKVGDHKLVLWPPDEYFDSVTPKIRQPSLEWVYGYSGFAHRNNIHMIAGTSYIVYFVGFVVIMYDLNADSQRIYSEHDAPVQCLAVTKNGMIAASGQSSRLDSSGNSISASVRLWQTSSLQTLHILKSGSPSPLSGAESSAVSGAILTSSIATITFTKDDDTLLVIDDNKPRILSVWSVDTGQVLAHKPCTESTAVCGILPLTATGKDGMYILYGRNLMEVWRIVPTEKRMDFVRQCVFGNIPKPTVVTFVMEMTSTIPSVANLPRQPHIISADSDGNIVLWSDEMRPRKVLQTGNKVPVFALCQLSASLLLAGSRDGQIRIFSLDETQPAKKSADTTVSATISFPLTFRIPEEYGGVRMLIPLVETDNILPESFIIGTTANCVLHVVTGSLSRLAANDQPDVKILSGGHFDLVYSVCQVAENGSNHALAITAGMDGNLNCYDLQAHKTLWRVFLKESMLTALDCYSSFVAVGTHDGKLKLFQLTSPNLTQLLEANVGHGKVSCVKFSPDGSRLAVGSQDSEIYLFKITEGEGNLMTSIGRFDKHDYPPVAIDWSRNPARDNHYVIHSNSYQFENFLWDAENMDYLEEAHFYRNIKWFTQSCVFGFAAVTSVTWESSLDGHVLCSEVSPTLDMVAAVTTLPLPAIDPAASSSISQAGQEQSSQTPKASNVVGFYSYPNANVQVMKHMLVTPSSGVNALRFCYVNNQLYILCVHEQDGSITQWLLR